MINQRQSFRMRKEFDFTWSVPDQAIEGEGIISNISLSGALFVTDKLFKPAQGLGMRFSIPQVPAFPSKGTLVWYRKVGTKKNQYQCGVRFLDDAALSAAWIKWMEDNIFKLADAEDSRILGRILSEERG